MILRNDSCGNLNMPKTLLFFLLLINSCLFAQTDSLYLYEMSECQEDDVWGMTNELISIDHYKEKSVVTIQGIANCDGICDVETEVKNDSIFIDFSPGYYEIHKTVKVDTVVEIDPETFEVVDTLIIENTVEEELHVMALCNCCFTFTFDFAPLDSNREYTVVFKGKPIYYSTHKYYPEIEEFIGVSLPRCFHEVENPVKRNQDAVKVTELEFYDKSCFKHLLMMIADNSPSSYCGTAPEAKIVMVFCDRKMDARVWVDTEDRTIHYEELPQRR